MALEDHPPAAAATAAILLGTAVAVALAELYSELLGVRVRLGTGVDRGHRARDRRERGGGRDRGGPAGWVLPAGGDGAIELGTAFSLAKWSGLGLMSFYGFAAARLSGADLKGSLLQALAIGAIGALVIAIKALVH